jgi:hypothetical protein
MRTWRVKAIVGFPIEFANAEGGASPSLPQTLERRSRIPLAPGTFGTTEVAMQAVDLSHYQTDGTHEPAAISFLVEADEAHGAIEVATPIIEDVVESLSFQLQQLIVVVQAEAVDVTPPVQPGDEREGLLFAYPRGPPC